MVKCTFTSKKLYSFFWQVSKIHYVGSTKQIWEYVYVYIYIYTYELQIWVLEAHNLTTCDLSNNLQYDLNQQTWQVDHEHFGVTRALNMRTWTGQNSRPVETTVVVVVVRSKHHMFCFYRTHHVKDDFPNVA